MTDIVLATGNTGKVAELQALLAKEAITIVPQSDYRVESVPETGTTFVENAIIKARHAAQQTGHPAIADDSGLSVDYLHGAPGVYSARYSGRYATDQSNINKLLDALSAVPNTHRQACFHCVLVYMRHGEDPTPLICHGLWQGHIAITAQGTEGFGYDPIFIPHGFEQTAAQLPAWQKNKLSHRAQALNHLIQEMKS